MGDYLNQLSQANVDMYLKMAEKFDNIADGMKISFFSYDTYIFYVACFSKYYDFFSQQMDARVRTRCHNPALIPWKFTGWKASDQKIPSFVSPFSELSYLTKRKIKHLHLGIRDLDEIDEALFSNYCESVKWHARWGMPCTLYCAEFIKLHRLMKKSETWKKKKIPPTDRLVYYYPPGFPGWKHSLGPESQKKLPTKWVVDALQ